MLITVTLPLNFSLRQRASSMAYSSKGFTMLGTPSRISVPVSGLIFTSVVSGTCLMHTTTFIPRPFPLPEFLQSYHPRLVDAIGKRRMPPAPIPDGKRRRVRRGVPPFVYFHSLTACRAGT